MDALKLRNFLNWKETNKKAKGQAQDWKKVFQYSLYIQMTYKESLEINKKVIDNPTEKWQKAYTSMS